MLERVPFSPFVFFYFSLEEGRVCEVRVFHIFGSPVQLLSLIGIFNYPFHIPTHTRTHRVFTSPASFLLFFLYIYFTSILINFNNSKFNNELIFLIILIDIELEQVIYGLKSLVILANVELEPE